MSEVAFAQLASTVEALPYEQQIDLFSLLSRLLEKKTTKHVSLARKLKKLDSLVGVIPKAANLETTRIERLARQ